MKNFFTVFLMICALFATGCGSEEKVIKVGTIKYLNLTEEQLDEITNKNNSDQSPKSKHIFFENMTSLTAALESERVDEMQIYRTVALYLMAYHNELNWEMSEPLFSDVFCCALREDDKELLEDFNGAIRQISRDGTLSYLVKEYLSEVIYGEEPPIINLPTFYDKPTIKIGVTGDLPLLDYIRPDGLPSGFNTALLAEISEIIEKNFVLVQIDSGARAAALSSKQVDVIFWSVVPKQGELFPTNIDKPDGVILTDPYFSDEIVHVKLRD